MLFCMGMALVGGLIGAMMTIAVAMATVIMDQGSCGKEEILYV